MLKYLTLATIVTVVSGHFGHAPATITYSNPSYSPHYGYSVTPAIAAQHSNIVRTYGNHGSVSTYMKTAETPFSVMKNSDFRFVAPGHVNAQSPSYIHMPVGVSAHARESMAAHAQIYVHGPTTNGGIVARVPHYNQQLLGMNYSPATAVSYVAPALPLGLNYGW